MKFILLILLAFALPGAGPLAATRLVPKDECARDPGFRAFRTKLDAVVARKDARQLLALTSDDISFSFGGGEGKREFAESWRLDRPAQSKLWGELEQVLRLGCAMIGGEAQLPYIYGRFPAGFDPFDHVVAVTWGAAARATADPQGRVVATLHGDILRLEGEPQGDWIQVRLADGRKAFVREADVRSPIDYRAIFAKRKGRWQMVAFIAGD